MTARLPGTLLVPYGVDTWQASQLQIGRQTRGGLELVSPFPCEAIDMERGVPLRLNNGSYHLDGMPDMTDSGGDEWLYVRDLLKRWCRPWDRVAGLVVERYFATLEDLVAAHADELDERLSRFMGLFERRHWLFSAPKPLPRAHVFAPAETPAATLDAGDFVAVDFAFWLGDRLVVVNSAQSTLTPKKARERAERLAHAGIEVLTVTASDLEEPDAAKAFFIKAMSPILPRFWEGDPLPAGPFRASALAI